LADGIVVVRPFWNLEIGIEEFLAVLIARGFCLWIIFVEISIIFCL
jgi:hypothetical protein